MGSKYQVHAAVQVRLGCARRPGAVGHRVAGERERRVPALGGAHAGAPAEGSPADAGGGASPRNPASSVKAVETWLEKVCMETWLEKVFKTLPVAW